MASHSALTEEGRTRIRNFQGRFNSYLILWIAVGVAVVVGGVWARTRYGYLPLQRLYLSQYIKASLTSALNRKRPSRYVRLVRVTVNPATGREELIPCTDAEVTPVRDESGKVIFDRKLGPFFRLRNDIPYRFFYWRSAPENDQVMYTWLRDHVYQGHSVVGLYWFCLVPFPIVVSIGMVVSVKVDRRANREYEEGTLLRGIRLLKHSEYARELEGVDGVGLPVLRPERSLR